MNHCTGCKKRTVLLCIFMICVQLIGMTGCASQDIVSGLHEPVIDNDLVKDVVYDCITFKVGESWVNLSQDDFPMYVYPDTRVVYSFLGSGYFLDWVKNEDNYFSYVLDYLRENDGLDKVTVLKRMDPYVTADGRDAYISRLRINQEFGGVDCYWDTDLLIIPENKFFVLLTVVYPPDETVPLDIREVVDTATFDFESMDDATFDTEVEDSEESTYDTESDIADQVFSVEGMTFYDKDSNITVEFYDSDNFYVYADPDNTATNFAYGNYKVYVGETALELLYENPDFGNTKYETQRHILDTISQDIYTTPEYHIRDFGNGYIIAIVFDTKGFVASDDSGIDFSSLYYGYQIKENDVLVLSDGTKDNPYFWEKEE